jgi:hypothetical protein
MTGAAPTDRAVNRATLARQHLLERAQSSALDEIAYLGGMQAQAPLAPYVGLWTRLHGFTHGDLSALYEQRQVVRIALLRSTIHLVTADDALAWRPVIEPTIVRATNAAFGRHYADLDREALAAAARELTEQHPRTFAELGALLAERFPDRDPAALAQAARAHLPLVQVPPRGVWGATGRIAHTTAQSWLGREVGDKPSADVAEAMVLRYLAAFGPASVMDAQTWSGLTRLREVFDRLRPALRVTRAQDGRTELFDLPDAPRPDPDTPAPARFLPEYDNLLFSYADRTRINPAGHPIPLFAGNGAALGYYLLDGVWSGLWRLERPRPARTKASTKTTAAATTLTAAKDGQTPAPARAPGPDTVRLTIQHFDPLTPAARDELTTEGLNLLAFLAADAASPEIHFTPPA